MLPSQLLKILGEPGTGAQVTLHSTHFASGEPYTGWLENDAGETIALLDKCSGLIS